MKYKFVSWKEDELQIETFLRGKRSNSRIFCWNCPHLTHDLWKWWTFSTKCPQFIWGYPQFKKYLGLGYSKKNCTTVQWPTAWGKGFLKKKVQYFAKCQTELQMWIKNTLKPHTNHNNAIKHTLWCSNTLKHLFCWDSLGLFQPYHTRSTIMTGWYLLKTSLKKKNHREMPN